MYRLVVVGVAAAVALAAAGCGSSSQRRITEAQFAPTLNAICAKAQAATAAAVARERSAQGDRRVRMAAVLVAGQQAMADGLDKIAPPAAMRNDFDTFKRETQARLELFQRMHAASSDGLQREAAANARVQYATFRRLDAIQHKYHLQGCA